MISTQAILKYAEALKIVLDDLVLGYGVFKKGTFEPIDFGVWYRDSMLQIQSTLERKDDTVTWSRIELQFEECTEAHFQGK